MQKTKNTKNATTMFECFPSFLNFFRFSIEYLNQKTKSVNFNDIFPHCVQMESWKKLKESLIYLFQTFFFNKICFNKMKNREKNWKFSKNEENCKKSKPRMYKVTGKTRCH